jgi:uncharacterized membrane protein
MRNLTNAGRIFYGAVMSGLGVLTIYYGDFPYMMIPPKHSGIPGLAVLVYLFGAILFLAGACIVFKKQTRAVSLLLGGMLLSIFVFYYVPYQFTASTNYVNLVDWENAEKELALCGGAFVIASCFVEKNENTLIRFLGKIAPLGPILFSITMISFGIIHFQYAKDVAEYVPSWVPFRLFWAYFCGAALICSGLAIILKIKVELVATLLGTMIFIWFAILHVPRVMLSPVAYLGSEITSALIALAYSGIAFVIAGRK